MSKEGSRQKYLVPVVSKALDVLEVFRTPQEELTLEQITRRTRIAHTTAFRILFTLVERGYVVQTGEGKRYRLSPRRNRTKVGFATLTTQTSFAEAITRSLEAAAQRSGLDLVVHSNELSPQNAIANAQALVAEKVDVAIEFQRHEHVAPIIAEIFANARIPTISVILPQPGAIYFGVNNYQAGLTAGLALGQHALDHWGGLADALLLLDLPEGGPFLQSRMTGVAQGVEQLLKRFPSSRVVRLDGKGSREPSALAAARYFRDHPAVRHVLVSAVNDESAQGALDAVAEAKLTDTCAIVGHGGSVEVRPLIKDPASPFLGTVDFFPERYGDGLVDLVFRLVRGDQIPPYHYMPHRLIRRIDTR